MSGTDDLPDTDPAGVATAASATAKSGPLPASLPIFPLPGALLLPFGLLPLNIFEPRYLNMVDDVMAEGRIVGMAQPINITPAPIAVPGDTDLYSIGCAGRIVSFMETKDDRYLITLAGVSRFRIGTEIPTDPEFQGYRKFAVDYDGFADDRTTHAGSDEAQEPLVKAVREYCDRRGITADWDQAETSNYGDLVTSIAMFCPFAPREKQALLESPTVTERGALLLSLMSMDDIGTASRDGTTTRH